MNRDNLHINLQNVTHTPHNYTAVTDWPMPQALMKFNLEELYRGMAEDWMWNDSYLFYLYFTRLVSLRLAIYFTRIYSKISQSYTFVL